MKVELRDDTDRSGWHNSEIGPRPIAIKRSLPFFVASKGSMTHRVRSGTLMLRTSSPFVGPLERWSASVSLRLWCGQHGFLLKRRGATWNRPGELHGGTLHAEPLDDRPLCATCEGRAIGAGLPSAAFLEQRRQIQFTPKELSHA